MGECQRLHSEIEFCVSSVAPVFSSGSLGIFGTCADFGERERLRQVWMCPQWKDGVTLDFAVFLSGFGGCLTIFCESQNQSSLEKALKIITLPKPPLSHVPRC